MVRQAHHDVVPVIPSRANRHPEPVEGCSTEVMVRQARYGEAFHAMIERCYWLPDREASSSSFPLRHPDLAEGWQSSDDAVMRFRRFYVYILLCNDGSYYTGITNNFEMRVHQHQEGIDPYSYTYERRPLQLVRVEEFQTAFEAISREKQIKRWSRAKKAALVKGDDDELSRLSKSKGRTSFRDCRGMLNGSHGSASSP